MILLLGIFYLYLLPSDIFCATGSLPSDTDDFKSVLLNTDTYIDKSLLIEEFLSGQQNNFDIVVRPRQWGKTLNLNMLETFFNLETYPNGTIVPDEYKQNGKLFTGGEFITNNGTKRKYLKPLKIAANQEIMKLQGTYIVINLKLSGIDGHNFLDFLIGMRRRVMDTFMKFEYLTSSCNVSKMTKGAMRKYFTGDIYSAHIIMSLNFLSEVLFQHFGRKSMIFIDDYDAPVINAYQRLTKDQLEDYMMTLYTIRSLCIQSLHLNPLAERGLISGTLKLHLLKPVHYYTCFDAKYSQHYGFDQHDLDQLLANVSFTPDVEKITQWYGYKYKDPVQFYNPGSVIRYIVHNGTFDYYWLGINFTSTDKLLLPDFILPHVLNYLRRSTNYITKFLDRNTFDRVEHINYHILLFFCGVVAPYRGVWNSSTDVCEMAVANLQAEHFLVMKLFEWVGSKLNMTVDEFHSFVYQPQVDTIEQKVDKFRAILQPRLNLSTIANDSYFMNISNVDLFYNALLLSSEKSISLNRAIYGKDKDEEKFGSDFVSSYFTKISEVMRFLFEK